VDEGAAREAAPVPFTEVIDHHQFAQAVCGCGWVGSARRSRSRARTEAHTHAAEHAAEHARAADADGPGPR
jgi:hypothetical protein